MLMFVIQSALLILIAFVLGCIVGNLVCRLFSSNKTPAATSPALTTPAPVQKLVEKPESEPDAPPVSEPPVSASPVTTPVSKATTKKPAVKKSTPKKPTPKKPTPKKPTTEKPTEKKSVASKKATKKAAPKPKTPATKDNLKEIKGIGPQNEARLNADGTTTFAQIAKWTAKDQREIGERLAFPGRIERENWVEQAKVLAKGGKTEFSKRVVRGEVSSSKGRAKK